MQQSISILGIATAAVVTVTGVQLFTDTPKPPSEPLIAAISEMSVPSEPDLAEPVLSFDQPVLVSGEMAPVMILSESNTEQEIGKSPATPFPPLLAIGFMINCVTDKFTDISGIET